MPSDTATFDENTRLTRARLRAGELLASRGVYGLVWLDEDLVVRDRFGSIVDFVEVGAPVTQSVLPIIGLEDEIRALKDAPDSDLRLPNVSVVTASGPGPRLNYLFHRFETERIYMMVVAQSGGGTDFDSELSRQIRARCLAEADAAAKSTELASANADLVAANNHLEQFAAIVSHDLKAPMRALRYMADEIEAALGANDAEAARRKLGEVRRQTKRLGSMLSALLHYSSVGVGRDVIETVDTLALVREIVRSLPHDGITVEITGDWPKLTTLAAPLDLALRNLVDNAIKHRDCDNGRVQISCADAGEALEITVADDGPGIPPEHQASIFLPFRTVRNGGEGMGLAIVKKMVDAAGGSIVLTSNPVQRRGTTLKIRWPKQIVL